MSDDEQIAYTAAVVGAQVLTVEGERIGSLERVLDIPDLDLFDGIVVKTDAGDRFVDRDQISHFTTTAVHCSLTAQQAAGLPEPDSPPTYRADPGQDGGNSVIDRVKRAFGRAKWTREKDDS
jgi:hypothetical protein